jgi:hypothetical protein
VKNRSEETLANVDAISRSFRSWFAGWSHSLYQRSIAIPPFLTRNMVWLAAGWVAFAGIAAALRMTFSATPVDHAEDAVPMLLVYGAIIIAPIAGYLIARSAYSSEYARQRPDFHLSFIGKWRRVSPAEASQHPMFGPVGFLASLLIGLMINVVIRSGEFFFAIPAMSALAPDWAMTMFVVMALDVIVMNFFYMVAFVMALRNIPLFPRMLLFVWLTDMVMQIMIANQISQIGSLPANVVEPLVSLLEGNLQKVAISIAVWMPFMLLSDRVNVTYRWRLAA